MNALRPLLALQLALCLAAMPALAQTEPLGTRTETASLPARGLFDGDRLSAGAQQQLLRLLKGTAGLKVDVALIMPTGPWSLDGRGPDERELTPARLQSLRRFFSDRGIDPKHVFVESRVDEKLKEPRLDVQIVGHPSED